MGLRLCAAQIEHGASRVVVKHHASRSDAGCRLLSTANDGRCGVERFLNMAGEGRPPRVDSMKCYMMGPHRVGVARPVYWPHGPSLMHMRVLQVASGRNHMACIAVPAPTANESPRATGVSAGAECLWHRTSDSEEDAWTNQGHRLRIN